jgi:hypothetical protein
MAQDRLIVLELNNQMGVGGGGGFKGFWLIPGSRVMAMEAAAATMGGASK